MRQNDGTHALIGLRLTGGVFALPLAVEGSAYLQRTGIPIEVAPLQTADLTAAQAGHQLRLEEVPPHLVLLHYLEEGIQLRTGEDTLGLVVGLGRRCPLSRISGNDMRLHRVFQCGVECGMDVAHHGVGELMPHLGMLVDAPLRFQAAVHPLDVLLGEEGDLLVAQLRLDVVFDVATVALEGTGPHRTRLVLREPAIQPLAQRHPAVLGQLHIAVALDVLVQLVQQGLLRLGIDELKDQANSLLNLVTEEQRPLCVCMNNSKEFLLFPQDLLAPVCDSDFRLILLSAMRYAMGRNTCMPMVVADYIKRHIQLLDDKFLVLAADEIRRHFEDYAEHELNPNLWQGLLDALETEQRERATCQARKVKPCPVCGKPLEVMSITDNRHSPGGFDVIAHCRNCLTDYEWFCDKDGGVSDMKQYFLG